MYQKILKQKYNEKKFVQCPKDPISVSIRIEPHPWFVIEASEGARLGRDTKTNIHKFNIQITQKHKSISYIQKNV